MESAVAITYRCNSRCQMCHTWKFPSQPSEELTPRSLESLPAGQTKINITGGEPTLRSDLMAIVEVLYPKTRRLEIISNGSFPDRLFEVAERYSDMTFRISLEGLSQTNDAIRGLAGGFDSGLRAILGLVDRGVRNVGISMTVSDTNASELLDVYRLASQLGVEFTQGVPHNSHYFHKLDNCIEDVKGWEGEVRKFIEALLTSSRQNLALRTKDWFRAYLNAGLLEHTAEGSRPLECGAATDFFFVDPYGKVLPCNGMLAEDPLGNLMTTPFNDIWQSARAEAVRARVRTCDRACWMIGSAVPAMRRRPLEPLRWVAANKVRLRRGRPLSI